MNSSVSDPSKVPILGVKVLCADDDPASLCLLSGLLRKEGYSVVEATDGAIAALLLKQPDSPKLIILDWVMPGVDGLALCRRIRALPCDQPPYIILLTSRDRKEDVIAGLDAGANDYLPKPYHRGELRARVAVGRRVIEIQAQLAERNSQLQSALDDIKTLRGIVPICASCKNVRDDKGYWEQVEVYVGKHSEASFSHSLCPDCIPKYFTVPTAKPAAGGSTGL